MLWLRTQVLSGIQVPCVLNPLLLFFLLRSKVFLFWRRFSLHATGEGCAEMDTFRGSSFVVFSDFSVWNKHPEYKKGAYLYSFRNLELYLTGNKVTAHTLWSILGLLSK